jgi:Tol biopolymer transport system component
MVKLFLIAGITISLGKGQEILRDPQEVHFKNVKKLTSGGLNAEAYFSPDGKYIVFQATRDTFKCDQIFLMDTTGKILRLISTGKGRTTCSFFLDSNRIMFASTHETMGAECPENPLVYEYIRKKIYAWPLFNYDIYVRDLRNDSLYKLFGSPYYDAELEGPSPDGKIVFTSAMNEDIDLYILEPPYTGNPRRLTRTPGYDGGSFFSRSGRYVVYRADHLKDSLEIKEFKELLQKGIVKLTHLEIYVYDLERDTFWQVTHTPEGVANFAPYFFPGEKRIIFASNLHAPGTWNFALYAIDIDGKNLERITYLGTFNSFPMFSPDGKKIIWASNRGTEGERREINIFMADWIP